MTSTDMILATLCDGDCRTAEEWRKAAQECIDTNGVECGDLEHFIAEQDAFENRFDEPELTRSQRFYMSPHIAMELNARRIAAARETVA